MQIWRWDQGRIAYFNFNAIKRIAPVLNELNGLDLRTSNDPLRPLLETQTGLPFLPKAYTLWRNYARIFKAELLATQIDGNLFVTDFCKKLALLGNDTWDVDDYLSGVIQRFYYPSPAFAEYDINSPQIFPFCALIRYLVAQYQVSGNASISLEDIFSVVIGNECQGTEPLDYYLRLQPTNRQPVSDEARQVREMLTFMSQISFLKWSNNRLYLDVLPGEHENIELIIEIATPRITTRHADRNAEIISLGTLSNSSLPVKITVPRELPNDLSFTEGKRVRRTHLRVERSPNLRKFFLATLPKPILCNMCRVDTNQRYPWTDNLLEVHHLLPLSSVINFAGTETSFADLVTLCPNCHKSTHVYYAKWLNDRYLEDFRSVTDAKIAYDEAKSQIKIEQL